DMPPTGYTTADMAEDLRGIMDALEMGNLVMTSLDSSVGRSRSVLDIPHESPEASTEPETVEIELPKSSKEPEKELSDEEKFIEEVGSLLASEEDEKTEE
ncbi:MAG: hypothetical protein ACFE7R_06310, partial [Candidatus Hodarchaeota archaeon]